MVTFGEIERKDVRVPYKKDDIDGYLVNGRASYDKQNKLIDVMGDIWDTDSKRIAGFSIRNIGREPRISLTHCITSMMDKAVEIAEATLADLAADYPKE